MILPISYFQFRIIIHIIIGLLFLLELFKPAVPQFIYKFLRSNKDVIFGIYYMYLAFDLYVNTNFKELKELRQ
jgi:hypothetical protein